MPQNCCVPGCHNATGGHRFPRGGELRKQWIISIKRVERGNKGKLWQPSAHSVVCHCHFLPTDYRETLLGECRRLKPDAVPSVFNFKPISSGSGTLRRERAARRHLHLSESVQSPVQMDMPCSRGESDVAMEVTVGTDEDSAQTSGAVMGEMLSSQSTNHVEIQCNLSQPAVLSVRNFVDSPRAILYYTGFKTYQQFMLLFSILGPCVSHLPVSCHLSCEDQLFMTLMKLRLATNDFELSILFGISQKMVSKIFLTWMNFMFYQLSEINFWPTKQAVSDTMPMQFKKHFPSTRVIIDATEFPIQKPTHVGHQSASFSTYKNTNTLKVLVGCTPRGLVSYVSDAYGGSTSDRQICERSDLIKKTTVYIRR